MRSRCCHVNVWIWILMFVGFPLDQASSFQDRQESVAPSKEKQQEATADEVFSGPQPGEALPELSALALFKDSTEQVLIVPGTEGKLQLIVFFHERTRPAFALMRGLIAWSNQLRGQLEHSVVFLTDDVGKVRQWSLNARRSIPDEARMFVSPDGLEGPGTWGLNRNVTMTVILGRDGKVIDNFAIVQPSAAADLEKITASVAQALNIDPPTNQELGKLLGQRQMDSTGTQTVDIRPLLAPVIQKTATPEQVKTAAEKVIERADKDVAFKIAVGDACRRIVNGGVLGNYGTEPAQEFLKTWAETFKADQAAEIKK